jgi:hypothetical protein
MKNISDITVKETLVLTDKENFIDDKMEVLRNNFGSNIEIYKIDRDIDVKNSKQLAAKIVNQKNKVKRIVIDTNNFAVISKILEMSYNIIRKEFNYEIYFLHREKNDIMII